MAWEEPKTNWQAADVVIKDDFNRIEGNAQHLKDAKADKTEFNLHVNNENNPHNVTASQVGAATPAQLAAKVDKPASAVSGNIAVFDGGAGKLKDGGQSINALTWVKPGNNIAVSHLPEESFLSSSSYGAGIMFSVVRPGKYRITGEIKAKKDSTGCVNIGISLLYSASYADRMESAANEFSTTSTSYVTFTVDMDKPVASGGIIFVNVRRAAVRNIRLRYADDFNPVPEFLGRM